jgi:hypothetical protein
MSRATDQRGKKGSRPCPWRGMAACPAGPDWHLRLLGTAPAEEMPARIELSAEAVRLERTRREIPTCRNRRKREA